MNFTCYTEKELKQYVIKNFNKLFDFQYVCEEFLIGTKRVDLVGEDKGSTYLIELKRDFITNNSVKQLIKYLNIYESSKNVVGIIMAPKIHHLFDKSQVPKNVIVRTLDSVTCIASFVPVNNTKKELKKVTFELPDELYLLAKERDEADHRSMNNFITTVVLDWYLPKDHCQT